MRMTFQQSEQHNARLTALDVWFTRLDRAITTLMAHYSIDFIRVALGVVFFWFGVLKFFPGLSPAQDLAARTISTLSWGLIGPAISLPVLAAWECAIGLGLIIGKGLRFTLFLLFLQMLGTMLPVVFFPQEVFTQFPIAPTLEGQYIIKNLVLIGAGLVIGATVRGGALSAERAGGAQVESA